MTSAAQEIPLSSASDIWETRAPFMLVPALHHALALEDVPSVLGADRLAVLEAVQLAQRVQVHAAAHRALDGVCLIQDGDLDGDPLVCDVLDDDSLVYDEVLHNDDLFRLHEVLGPADLDPAWVLDPILWVRVAVAIDFDLLAILEAVLQLARCMVIDAAVQEVSWVCGVDSLAEDEGAPWVCVDLGLDDGLVAAHGAERLARYIPMIDVPPDFHDEAIEIVGIPDM